MFASSLERGHGKGGGVYVTLLFDTLELSLVTWLDMTMNMDLVHVHGHVMDLSMFRTQGRFNSFCQLSTHIMQAGCEAKGGQWVHLGVTKSYPTRQARGGALLPRDTTSSCHLVGLLTMRDEFRFVRLIQMQRFPWTCLISVQKWCSI